MSKVYLAICNEPIDGWYRREHTMRVFDSEDKAKEFIQQLIKSKAWKSSTFTKKEGKNIWIEDRLYSEGYKYLIREWEVL